jgi:hypothetical protein
MSTGNWVYDNLMARRQAQEMASAFERSQRARERQTADVLLHSGEATPYCSKCGRQWKRNYYRASTVFRWFIVGLAMGAVGLEIALRR